MRKQQVKEMFTLVEVIAVIVILGILAATIVPKLGRMTTESEKAMIQACVNQLNSRSSVVWATESLGGTRKVTPMTVAKETLADEDGKFDYNMFGVDFILKKNGNKNPTPVENIKIDKARRNANVNPEKVKNSSLTIVIDEDNNKKKNGDEAEFNVYFTRVKEAGKFTGEIQWFVGAKK